MLENSTRIKNKSDKSNYRTNNFLISLAFFSVAFFPFRYVVNKYTMLHITLIQYLPLLIIVFYRLFFYGKIKINIILFLIAFYCLISIAWTLDINAAIKWALNIFIGIILGEFFSSDSFDESQLIFVSIGVIACNIFLLPNIVTKLPILITNMSLIRIPSISGDISVGPNGWASLLALSCMILMYLETIKKIKFSLFIVLFSLTIYFMVLTRSQNNLYSCFLIIGIHYFIKIKKRKSRAKILYILLLIICLYVIYLIPKYIDKTTNVYEFDLNERDAIWSGTIDIFTNKLNILQILFGSGAGSTGRILANHWSLRYDYYLTADHLSAHSTYLDSLISIGLIGTIVYLGYWAYMLVKLLRYSEKPYYLFPLYFFISGIAYHMFANWYFGLLLGLTLAGMNKKMRAKH